MPPRAIDLAPSGPAVPPAGLALFDLDHTLVPFDTGMAWTRHLIDCGAIEPEVEHELLQRCTDYVGGRIDIWTLSRFGLGVLARFPMAQLQALRARQADRLAATLSPAAHTLVQHHRARGDLCAIVTATVRFVAQPYAEALGVPHLLATEAALHQGPGEQDPRPTGELGGTPCWGPEKPATVARWLRSLGLQWRSFATVHVYSDAYSDLPLLLKATHPVAVAPDARLRAHAQAQGWALAEKLEALSFRP